jgi:salicylate hydroxylase
MVSSQCKIGVVGAGSSGLFLGILLTQQGYQVDIFEKFSEVRTDGCGSPQRRLHRKGAA